VELAQHLEEREVRTSIVDNPFAAILDEKFQELETLPSRSVQFDLKMRLTNFVNLSPFLGCLFGETFVYHGHDLVE
jgi:hypothetical protein